MSGSEIFTKQGRYLMLALDHRESFLKMMGIAGDEPGAAISLKGEIIASLINQVSGILIDQDYGLPAYKGFYKPFLLPMEASTVQGSDGIWPLELKYSAAQIKDLGAGGTKLNIHFSPRASNAAKQIDLAKQAVAESRSAELPHFLEIRTYDPADPTYQISGQVVLG